MPRYLLSAIIGFCGAVGPAQAAPLAERIPADTICYAGWAGRNLILDGSAAGQLLAQETLRELLAAARQAALGHLDDPLQQEIFNGLWAMAAVAWQHPMAVALVDLHARNGSLDPDLILLVELGTDQDAFAKQLDELLQALGKEREIRQETVGKVSYWALPGPDDRPLAVGFVGELFFATLGEGLARRVIDLPQTESLAADSVFHKALTDLAGGEPQAAWYLDIASLIGRLDEALPAPGPSDGQPAGGRASRLAAAIGLENATHLAGAASILDRGLLVRTRLSCPAPHRRILAVFSGQALTDEDLVGIPAGASHLLAIRKPPAEIYDQFTETLEAVNPSAAQELQAALAQLEQATQLAVKQDLLGALEETWTISCAAPWGGWPTGYLAAFGVNDPARLAAALEKIQRTLEGISDSPDAPVKLLVTRTAQAEIHYLRLRRSPIAPAWALHEETLYVAAWPQVIASRIQGAQPPALVGSAEFKTIRSRLTSKPSVLEYFNLAAILRQSYPLLLMAWTSAASGELAGSACPFSRPDRLPALATLEKYIWPSIAVASSDPEGITFESYGSLPLSGPAGSPGALLGGIALLLRFALQPEDSAATGPVDAPPIQQAPATEPKAPEAASSQPAPTTSPHAEPPQGRPAASQAATSP